MSDTTKTDFVPKPLEELTFFWLTNGAPCFVGTTDDICKHVEAHGFQIYYVMTTEVFTFMSNSVKKTERRPQVFKVVNSIISKAVTPISPSELKFAELEANAWFKLPKIPYYLVQKIDDFFRLIEKTQHTEAIVLLTYDTEKTGPEGWGVLIPKQENTAADCSYEPDSVIDDKPASVFIVGSAHSHPNMSAYASGTDHKDQDGNDGLHITYGWQSSKNHGQTEFHIELQVNKTIFPFNADQVFENFPEHEPSEDVQEWAKNVSKKTWSGNTGTKQHGTGTGAGNGVGFTGSNSFSNPRGSIKVPDKCPPISQNIVIAFLLEEDRKCPFCEQVLISVDRTKRRCMSCHQYLWLPGDTLEDLVDARVQAGVYTSDIDVTRTDANKPIYLWRRGGEGGAGNSYELLFDPKAGKPEAVGTT